MFRVSGEDRLDRMSAAAGKEGGSWQLSLDEANKTEQMTEWRKPFASDASNKGLICKMDSYNLTPTLPAI